jgi:hypothetical protein
LSAAQSRSHCASSVMKSVPCRQHRETRSIIGGWYNLVVMLQLNDAL